MLKPSGFTSKVQIKNLELSKRLVADFEPAKGVAATVRQHGLMNVGSTSAQGHYNNLQVLLERTDTRLESS